MNKFSIIKVLITNVAKIDIDIHVYKMVHFSQEQRYSKLDAVTLEHLLSNQKPPSQCCILSEGQSQNQLSCFCGKYHMASSDWYKVTWTCQNLMWKFHFGTSLPNLTFTHIVVKEATLKNTPNAIDIRLSLFPYPPFSLLSPANRQNMKSLQLGLQ